MTRIGFPLGAHHRLCNGQEQADTLLSGYLGPVLQNILLPVDESPPFEAAFATALELALTSPDVARIDALFVLSVSKRKGRFLEDLSGMLGFEPVLVPEKVEAWYRAQGQSLLQDVVDRGAAVGQKVRAISDQGAVLERLLHHASGVDLVIAGVGDDGVVALSGQGECMADRFLKRVATTVLLASNRKVDFKGICMGYDGSDGANCALRSVRRLASIVKCPVHVVYAEDGRQEEGFDPTGPAVELLTDAGIAVTTAHQVGEAHEVLQAECQAVGFDLLAVGYRGRTGLSGRVLGRVTECLVDEMETALLVSR